MLGLTCDLDGRPRKVSDDKATLQLAIGEGHDDIATCKHCLSLDGSTPGSLMLYVAFDRKRLAIAWLLDTGRVGAG